MRDSCSSSVFKVAACKGSTVRGWSIGHQNFVLVANAAVCGEFGWSAL